LCLQEIWTDGHTDRVIPIYPKKSFFAWDTLRPIGNIDPF